MTKKKGHPILGAVAGFFCVLGLVLVLLATGSLNVGDKLPAALPFLGLVVGAVWGFFAPLGRGVEELT